MATATKGITMAKNSLNPFIPNATFLYYNPPENIRISYGFLMFTGGREMLHWGKMG